MAVLVDMFFDYPRKFDHFDMTEKVLKDARARIFMIEASIDRGAANGEAAVRAMAARPGAKVTLVSAEVGDLQQPLLRLDSNPKPAALAVYLALCLQIAKATCPDPETWKPRGEMEVAWGFSRQISTRTTTNAPSPTRYGL